MASRNPTHAIARNNEQNLGLYKASDCRLLDGSAEVIGYGNLLPTKKRAENGYIFKVFQCSDGTQYEVFLVDYSVRRSSN